MKRHFACRPLCICGNMKRHFAGHPKTTMRPNALFVLFFAASAWAGVPGGVVGSITQPQPQTVIHDLRAVRKGNTVTLTWSRPSDSAASAALTICRTISSSPGVLLSGSSCTPVGHLDSIKSPKDSKTAAKSATLHFNDKLDQKLEQTDPPQFAVYRITLPQAGRQGAAYSNSASVSLAPVPEIRQLHSSLDQRGVYLIWEAGMKEQPAGVEFDFRLRRRQIATTAGEAPNGKSVAVHFLHSVLHQDEGERWGAVDNTAEWEKSYNYWLTPVVRVYSAGHELLAEFEGDDSDPLEVVMHDVFPPAPPEGLMVIAGDAPGKNFVDVIWSPNAEPDIGGYNIYRREEGAAALVRIGTAPASMLSYQDKNVSSGRIYNYAISAVDLRGNESRKGPESAEVKP
jgi:hypothetical protein